MGLIKASIVTFIAFLVLQLWFYAENPMKKYIPEKYELYIVLIVIFIIELML